VYIWRRFSVHRLVARKSSARSQSSSECASRADSSLGGDLGGSYRRDLLENLSTPLLFWVDSEMGGAEEY